jgi:hypothetical protein
VANPEARFDLPVNDSGPNGASGSLMAFVREIDQLAGAKRESVVTRAKSATGDIHQMADERRGWRMRLPEMHFSVNGVAWLTPPVSG